MQELYFIRHGRTVYNAEHRVQGSGIDSDLDAIGREQAGAFYQSYVDEAFDLIITSALKRTKQTVQAFIDLGIPHIETPLLNEISWGVMEGQIASPEMRAQYLQLIKDWGEGKYNAKIEGGESAQDMGRRLSEFVTQLRERKEKKILICTHGGALAFLLPILQEQELWNMVNNKHHNTGLCLFEFDGQNYHLKEKDSTAHLSSKKEEA